jgi:hypothetical protein
VPRRPCRGAAFRGTHLEVGAVAGGVGGHGERVVGVHEHDGRHARRREPLRLVRERAHAAVHDGYGAAELRRVFERHVGVLRHGGDGDAAERRAGAKVGPLEVHLQCVCVCVCVFFKRPQSIHARKGEEGRRRRR